MSERIDVLNRKGEHQWITINLGEESLQYIARSSNTKTGVVPTQYIGNTREESEETCRICPLWSDETCYAQDGSVQMGHSSLLRAVRKGADRSLRTALYDSHRGAKYVRNGAIGDPGSIAPPVYKEHEELCRTEGFGVLSYTHQWYLPHAEHLKGHALASCDTALDVQESVGAGWRAAVHVDENDTTMFGATIAEKPQGTVSMNGTEVKYFLCPAQRETKKPVLCNDCGLCDGTRSTKYNTIVFIEHRRQMGFKKLRESRAAVTKGE